MAEIYSTNGYKILVDDTDYLRLSNYTWRVYKKHKGLYPQTRSVTFLRALGMKPRLNVYLHWMILPPKDGHFIDHVNGDTLDNRRANLRYATAGQSVCNRGVFKNGASEYKGVSWKEKNRAWQAAIQHQGRRFYLGLYHSEVDAARAYDVKARQIHGEFARLNFPEEV